MTTLVSIVAFCLVVLLITGCSHSNFERCLSVACFCEILSSFPVNFYGLAW